MTCYDVFCVFMMLFLDHHLVAFCLFLFVVLLICLTQQPKTAEIFLAIEIVEILHISNEWLMLFVATSGASLPAAAFQTKIFDCSSHILMTRTSSARASSMAFQKPMQPIMYAKAASTIRFLVAGNAGEKNGKVDIDALLKYTVSALVQMAAFAAILSAFDKGIEVSGFQPPIWLSCIFFYACSLKSRILNPLSNERPMVGNPTGF